MLFKLHSKRGVQLVLGLLMGIVFGFLLEKGGVTHYDVILSQLLLEDFTVVKIMLTAIVTGMLGVHVLKKMGLARMQIKPGSFGMNVIGGLIFGAAFAILGYCPGTAVGAIGSGALDALVGGLTGMLVGAGLFAEFYPRFSKGILTKGHFGKLTFPEMFKVNPWIMVIIFSGLILLILYLLERFGL